MYLESYKELLVWQKAVSLVEKLYKTTAKFPKEDLYGLTAQMRRAAVSIPSNIAEGSRRKDIPEYLHFLRISDASSAELETQCIIAKKLYPEIDFREIELLLNEIQKMLRVMMSKLEAKQSNKGIITKS